MNPDCPPDDELLTLASDEPVSAIVHEHVDNCAACRMRLNLLRGDIAELRSLSQNAAHPPSKTLIVSSGVSAGSFPPTIGRYVVIGDLGSGGQADVYRVIDPELGRSLVLKLSHRPARNSEGRRDALLAEGRLLAELDHPGLVRIFDVGVHDGLAYLVLEHVPGKNLEQVFKDRRPTPHEAARIIAEVSRVVAYAHRRGVVHGDITPRNILIDVAGRPRLIDFGLSKIENAWGEGPDLSGGTPEFLPPEVSPLSGRAGGAGPASDVFGLGATLYWLLTGEAPFAAPTGALALVRSHRCDIDFEALHRARVPGRVARICQQALAAEPANRPTPEAVADELERASFRMFTPRFVAGIIILVLACVGVFVWLSESGETDSADDQSSVQSAPAIEVFSRDGIRTLSNELPLHTGDRVAIWCDISQGHQATMFWFNPAGDLKSLSPVREVFEKVDRLYYPDRHRPIALDPPEGTDLIFFCRDGQIADDELQACFPVGTPLPRLPARNWLTLRRHEVTTEGPLSGVPKEILDVEQIMKEIDRKLRRHFQGVTGIAFPHYPAASRPG